MPQGRKNRLQLPRMWILLVGLSIVLTIGASFWIWRRMRIDYSEQRVLWFSLVWAMCLVIGVVAGGRFGVPIWTGLAFSLSMFVLWALKLKWDGWDWLDTLIPTTFGVGLVYGLANRMWPMSGIMMVHMILSLVALRTYRRWRWYKSGKPGIVGLAGLVAWSGVQILFFSLVNQLIGAVVVAVCVVAILLRSRVLLAKQ